MQSHRKKPFSNKQKKAQLQEKRARKRQPTGGEDVSASDSELSGHDALDKLETKPPLPSSQRAKTASKGIEDHRYLRVETRIWKGFLTILSLESVFAKLSEKQIQEQKEISRRPLVELPPEVMEIGFENLYADHALIDFPKRPSWSLGDSKTALENREEAYFQTWLTRIYDSYPASELSYFEHNLQVWRQLWRVVEMCDILLFVVDARHPILHFPPTLYDYVIKEQGKKLVLVFNKIDLICLDVLRSWQAYFKARFPEMTMACFSCYPKDRFVFQEGSTAASNQWLQKRSKRSFKRYFQSVGVRDILEACKSTQLLRNDELVDWDTLLAETLERLKEEQERAAVKEARSRDNDGKSLGRSRRRQRDLEEVEESESGNISASQLDSSDEEEDSDAEADLPVEMLSLDPEILEPSRDWITIGTVGHPNVGKSSLINGIMGKKVVSVSKTPGHTKHFQTIHLSDKIRLCDCPGLVFPALIPKPVQILSGMYRIAQVQEPYTAISYLADRIPIVKVLQLKHPDQEEPGFQWSGWTVCEAFALQRGFLTPRAARPDVYRAANMLLRMANDGRLLLIFRPPLFSSSSLLK